MICSGNARNLANTPKNPTLWYHWCSESGACETRTPGSCSSVLNFSRFSSLMTVSLIDQEAVLKAFAAGLRLDGRTADEYRRIEFAFSPDTRGQVLVQLGDSK
jgi:hypothetical protein